jgi:hypothetical protein
VFELSSLFESGGRKIRARSAEGEGEGGGERKRAYEEISARGSSHLARSPVSARKQCRERGRKRAQEGAREWNVREEVNPLGVGERRPEPTIQPSFRPERVLPLSSVLF